jgi:uncharacterized protein YfaS (alpha-2-macroglobulin family)
VEFNNPLRPVKGATEFLRITPKVADLEVRISSNFLTVSGGFLPSTTYQFEVLPGLSDSFGQRDSNGGRATLKYGEASPFFRLAHSGFGVLESKLPPRLGLSGLNRPLVQVRLAPVPADRFWEVAVTAGSQGWHDRNAKQDPFAGLEIAWKKDFNLGTPLNVPVHKEISLSPALGKDGFGVVLVEARDGTPDERHPQKHTTLLVSTNLGLTALKAHSELAVLVTALDSAAPLAAIPVEARDCQGKVLASGRSGPDGLLRLTHPALAITACYLVATQGNDRSYLPLEGQPGPWGYESSYRYWTYGSTEQGYQERLSGTIFSDRGLYRPAEEVNLQVLVRITRPGPRGDLRLLSAAEGRCTFSLQDPRGADLHKGDLQLSIFGTGTIPYTLPKDASLGYYQALVTCPLGNLSGSFQVQEFKTPEFKALAAFALDGSPVLVGKELTASVSASYFFGGPMAGAKATWRVQRSAAWFSPPGNPGFHFGRTGLWSPWRYDFGAPVQEDNGLVASGEGTLDSAGTLSFPVRLDPGAIDEGPVSFELEAEVQDRNRQSLAARATVLAHRCERFVGLRLDRSVLKAGEQVQVFGVVANLDGSRPEGATATVQLIEINYKSIEKVGDSGEVSYDYQAVETPGKTCTLSSGPAPGSCLLTAPKAGSYLVRATTLDLQGRRQISELSLWVAGEGGFSYRADQEAQVELKTDQEEYRGGDTARILVRAPFSEGTGVLLASREGLAAVLPFAVKDGSALVELPISELHAPALSVTVVALRGRSAPPGEDSQDRGRPTMASGGLRLPVSLDSRRLQVTLQTPSRTIAPGGTLKVAITTADPWGKPLKAALALMVVDEGVLSLIAHQTPNPLEELYTERPDGTAVTDLRPQVVPRVKPKLELAPAPSKTRVAREMVMSKSMAMPAAAPMAAGMAMDAAVPMQEMAAMGGVGDNGVQEEAPTFALREIFKASAYFNGSLETDADGKLSLDIPMPDNLTEFRIMAVAANEGPFFGSAEDRVQVRRPVMVRPALPRFANFGDSFEAAVLVSNYTGFDTEVLVRLVATGAEVEGPAVRSAPVADGASVELRFPVRPLAPGAAVFQFAAVSLTAQRHTDAAKVTVPVLVPATAEAFATYGTTEAYTAQPLATPTGVLPDFGGLDLTLSSTALTGLQDALKYLVEYPFECTEQLCSRILPILALGPILKDFGLAQLKDEARAKQLVEEGLKKIQLHQREDGGFGAWQGSNRSWLHMSAYAALTLEEARLRGFAVPPEVLESVATFLATRLDSPLDWEVDEPDSHALAVLALARLKVPSEKHAARLFALVVEPASGKPALSLYAQAFLAESLFLADPRDPRVDTLVKRLSNAALETASAIHFAERTRESSRLLFHSEERSDAIILGTLLKVRPKDAMIPKIVRGLLAARTNGTWQNTQTNAFALLALAAYYQAFEGATPDFEAGVWLGQEGLFGHSFKGRSMELVSTRVPMKELLATAAADLVVGKKGPGRLYYRLGLRYAPENLKLDALDRGFGVERQYLDAATGQPLPRDASGALEVEAGALVQVKLRVTAPDRRYYAAVVDPLPAGLEAENQAFVTTATQRGEARANNSWPASRWSWWYWSPWDFTEFRDDRVQLFADSLYGGVHEYSYTARATTLGTFVVPPTRAEEMYTPETFGRCASDRLTVKPAID